MTARDDAVELARGVDNGHASIAYALLDVADAVRELANPMPKLDSIVVDGWYRGWPTSYTVTVDDGESRTYAPVDGRDAREDPSGHVLTYDRGPVAGWVAPSTPEEVRSELADRIVDRLVGWAQGAHVARVLADIVREEAGRDV